MILVLVGSARAGDTYTPPAPAPPPQGIVTQEPTDDSIATDTSDTLTGIALDLLAVLPSLF